MIHSSIKLNTPCEFINITPLNPLISKCEIKVCYVSNEPNRNRSIITKEVATEMANSLPGSPIVGFFNEAKEDFEEHNRIIDISNGEFKIKDTTKPYGFVDLNARVWFQKFLDDGVYEREYLMTEGYLWTGQYPEAQRVIEHGNNQSMELDPESIDAHWTKDNNGNPQFFIINEAIISKLCILGEDCEPCFEGATISKLQFSFEDSFKEELFSMMREIKEILNEGGVSKMEENIEKLENEELENVEEEKDKEVTPEEEEVKPDEEVVPEKDEEIDSEEKNEENVDEVSQYNLDEIPEYIELNSKFSNLETQYNELLAEVERKDAELAELIAFRKKVEKAEKENMIQQFYMLSEEDKADVVNNIDNYSLDEIEAKLSIICVRNKVNFNLEDDNTDEAPVVYNLNSDPHEDDSIPAWVKAAMAIENSLK